MNLKSVCVASLLLFVALSGQINTTNAKESNITPSSVIKLTNQARKDANVAILNENPKLKVAAENKAKDMLRMDYFAHISPEGKTPWDFIVEQGYDYRFAGENLAIDYSDVREQHEAWMESFLHRKNILNPEYEEIGVAVVSGKIEGKKTILTVQEFGTKVAEISENPLAQENVLPTRKAVAGISMQESGFTSDSFVSLSSAFSKKLEFGQIFEDNKLTMIGWLGAFALALLMTISDMLVLLYKKHKNHLDYMK